MKAVRLHARGDPERMVFEEEPLPRLGPGDALVRVHAAAITPTELTWSATWTTRDGADRLPVVPSHEVSGVVEAVGEHASGVAVGNPVYGLVDFWRDGAAAEYVAVPAADLAPKPPSIDHVHAAAVPLSGLTAWQALLDHAALSAGQRVLVHGGAGGVGAFAVQLARWRGAHVVATGSASDRDLLREVGVEDVIDYRTERFEARVRDVDVVLDTVGGDTLERSWSVIRPGGVLVTVAAPAPGSMPSRGDVRGDFFIVQPERDQLIELARLIDAGSLRPIVGGLFPLARAREAYLRAARGHTRGKVVLRVRD
jgi:NADPH:quinone reductase-like Zn-dependent oxidoreductase